MSAQNVEVSLVDIFTTLKLGGSSTDSHSSYSLTFTSTCSPGEKILTLRSHSNRDSATFLFGNGAIKLPPIDDAVWRRNKSFLHTSLIVTLVRVNDNAEIAQGRIPLSDATFGPHNQLPRKYKLVNNHGGNESFVAVTLGSNFTTLTAIHSSPGDKSQLTLVNVLSCAPAFDLAAPFIQFPPAVKLSLAFREKTISGLGSAQFHEVVHNVRSNIHMVVSNAQKLKDKVDAESILGGDMEYLNGRLVMTNLRVLFVPYRSPVEKIIFDLFDELDLDGSGDISIKELKELLHASSSADGSDHRPLDQDLIHKFESLDVDGDGSVSVSEAINTLIPHTEAVAHGLMSIPIFNIASIDINSMSGPGVQGRGGEGASAEAVAHILAEGAIRVEITNHTNDSSGTTFYHITITCESLPDDKTWSVERRFSQFAELHAHLTKTFPRLALPALPPKDMLGSFFGHGREFYQGRRDALNVLLQAAAASPQVWMDTALGQFLDASPDLVHIQRVYKQLTISMGTKQSGGVTGAEGSDAETAAGGNGSIMDDGNFLGNLASRTDHVDAAEAEDGADLTQEAFRTRLLRLNTKDGRKLYFAVQPHSRAAMAKAARGALWLRGAAGDNMTGSDWCRYFKDEVLWMNRKDAFALEFTRAYFGCLKSVQQGAAGNEGGVGAADLSLTSRFDSSSLPHSTGSILLTEFTRQRVEDHNWRVTDVNEDYKFASYPSVLVVPASVDDEALVHAAKERSKSRIPALTWLHPVTKAPLCRSSQPMSGMFNATLAADDALLIGIRSCASSPDTRTLRIVDCRPKINARANALMGKGFEDTSRLGNAEVHFMCIDNIHDMRHSLEAFSEAVSGPQDGSGTYLPSLQASKWISHLEKVVRGALFVASKLEAGDPVLVHCSDGWDRTSQLSSLPQLLLDPYFRTIQGFQVLVEKDWCSFGHMFSQRTGPPTSHESSPIFLQFLDVVYQLTRQFPTAFEFNENYLLAVVEGLYSHYFTTFLGDHESDRKAHIANLCDELASSDSASTASPSPSESQSLPPTDDVASTAGGEVGAGPIPGGAVSLWAYLRDMFDVCVFKNALYVPPPPQVQVSLLRPTLDVRSFVVWEGLYCRNGQSLSRNISQPSELELLRNFALAHF